MPRKRQPPWVRPRGGDESKRVLIEPAGSKCLLHRSLEWATMAGKPPSEDLWKGSEIVMTIANHARSTD